jgi:hypothetical protein
MKVFKVKIDATILAKDLDDAFLQIGEYYRAMYSYDPDIENPPKSIFIDGEAKITGTV